ncbi:hypothetical protein MCOR01_011777 [Pyricularia oryzae]|nr:hypothetical protein MCOR01_011777 [Pyricularia oryzae]
MDISPEQALRDSLKSLRISGDYSDMTVVCGHDTYHVHKAIMCPRSKYFEIIQSRYAAFAQNPSLGFEIKKEPTNIEFPAAAVAEADDVTTERGDPPAEPEVHDPWEEPLALRKGKKQKKKGKSIAMTSQRAHQPRTLTRSPSALPNRCLTKPSPHALPRLRLAEYLQVGDLKGLAARKFRTEAEKHWNHPDFFEAVQEVYRTSVRTIGSCARHRG